MSDSLMSSPSAAVVISRGEVQAVADAEKLVFAEAKAASDDAFVDGIDEGLAPVRAWEEAGKCGCFMCRAVRVSHKQQSASLGRIDVQQLGTSES